MSRKQPHSTDREELKRRIDALCDHYEKFAAPGAGATIQVDCTEDDLSFASRDELGTFHYRGRVLLPVHKKAMSRREFEKRHATI